MINLYLSANVKIRLEKDTKSKIMIYIVWI